MGERTKKSALINHAISAHIHSMMRRSGTKTLLCSIVGLFLLIGFYLYAEQQLKFASGDFVIGQSSQGIIHSTPVLDEQHAFDDYVATIQSNVARELTSSLNFTTTTFAYLDKRMAYAQGSFRDDVMTNLNNYNITDKMLKNDSVYRLKFTIIGSPLMIDASSEGVPLVELYDSTDVIPLNEVQLDKMTIEVRAEMQLYRKGRLDRKYTIQFVVNIIGESRTEWHFESMSAWES